MLGADRHAVGAAHSGLIAGSAGWDLIAGSAGCRELDVTDVNHAPQRR
jgi:hypothetical protein